MKKFLIVLVTLIMTAPMTFALTLYPDSKTAKTEVELGVEGIQRLCPTGMWNHWIFRDILFDRESDSVFFVIQLNRWKEKKSDYEVTEYEAKKEAEWIISNLKAGYESLVKNPAILCDGDFMLYLSVGTLLKQMEKDGVNLQIMLLKPDYLNQVLGENPVVLSPEELKEVKAKQ